MSDRFYQQQCEFFNVSPSAIMVMERFPDLPESKKLKQKLLGRKAETKADIILDIFNSIGFKEVQFSGLEKLTKDRLVEVRDSINLTADTFEPPQVEIPTKNTKAPYISIVQQLIGREVDLKALTITTLKNIIDLYGI